MKLGGSCIATVFALCFLLIAPAAVAATESPIPSVVVEMANRYIDGSTPASSAKDRARAVHWYGAAFLDGFVRPGMTGPGNHSLWSDAMNQGQQFWLAHPDQRDAIMRGYGYVLVDVAGTLVVGFETSRFTPKNTRVDPNTKLEERWWIQSWGDDFRSDIHANNQQQPLNPSTSTVECRAKGYLSPPGAYGHLNHYDRQLFVFEMTAAPH